jgi:surface antigen
LVDITPSSDMDDLFDFGGPRKGPDAAAHTPAATPQYGSRREARDATGASRPAAAASSAATPSVSRKQERAASRRSQLSRPSSDRRAVSRAVREFEVHQPASRKLRRAELAAIHASAPKAPRKNPLRALATMAIVGGMFAVAGIPAYAMTNATTASSAKQAQALDSQSIVVSADATVLAASRDGYRATTPAELEEMSKDDIRAQNNADYLLSGARELGDDYPWPYELSSAQGGGLSPLNYYYRECVDFVAWRLNRDAGSFAAPYKWVWSTLTPTGGNASQWEYAWEQHGWPISDTPIVGSVAWFGWSNHVAYVKAVHADGTVLIEEYNYVPGVYSQRTIPITDVEDFLYPPT